MSGRVYTESQHGAVSWFYLQRARKAPRDQQARLLDLSATHDALARVPDAQGAVLARLRHHAGSPGFSDFIERFAQ